MDIYEKKNIKINCFRRFKTLIEEAIFNDIEPVVAFMKFLKLEIRAHDREIENLAKQREDDLLSFIEDDFS